MGAAQLTEGIADGGRQSKHLQRESFGLLELATVRLVYCLAVEILEATLVLPLVDALLRRRGLRAGSSLSGGCNEQGDPGDHRESAARTDADFSLALSS